MFGTGRQPKPLELPLQKDIQGALQGYKAFPIRKGGWAPTDQRPPGLPLSSAPSGLLPLFQYVWEGFPLTARPNSSWIDLGQFRRGSKSSWSGFLDVFLRGPLGLDPHGCLLFLRQLLCYRPPSLMRLGKGRDTCLSLLLSCPSLLEPTFELLLPFGTRNGRTVAPFGGFLG